MVISEVDSDPERNAVTQYEDIDDDVRAEGEATCGPVVFLVFFSLLRFALASLASQVLDKDAVGGEAERRENGHEHRCPGAKRGNVDLKLSCRFFRREDARKRDEDGAKNDQHHTDPVVSFELLTIEDTVGDGHVERTKSPDDGHNARVDLSEVCEPHRDEGEGLGQQVHEAVSDEAEKVAAIALSLGSTGVIGQLDGECSVKFKLASRAVLDFCATIVEDHDEVVNQPDGDRAGRKVEEALRAFSLSDLADALIAHREEDGGAEGPDDPDH